MEIENEIRLCQRRIHVLSIIYTYYYSLVKCAQYEWDAENFN